MRPVWMSMARARRSRSTGPIPQRPKRTIAVSSSSSIRQAVSQAALGPLGISDATARTLVVGGLRDPQLSSTHASVTAVRRAYERLPAPGRDAAVAAAFAWAKAYVGSPAFGSAYAA